MQLVLRGCRPSRGRGRRPRITHAWSIIGGATMPPCTEAAAASASVYTGFSSPIASTQWRIIGLVHRVGRRRRPRPTCRPSNALQLARAAHGRRRSPRLPGHAAGRPTATISRCTSLTPPPKVLICAARAGPLELAARGRRPGEPAAQVARRARGCRAACGTPRRRVSVPYTFTADASAGLSLSAATSLAIRQLRSFIASSRA